MGVRAGPDRRRAVPGRVRGGRFRWLAARAGAPHPGRGVTLRSAVRAGRGADARRCSRLHSRGAGVPTARAAAQPVGGAGRPGGRGAGGVRRPRPCLARRSGRAADPGRTAAARLDPALRDPPHAQRASAAVRVDPARVRPLRPVPAHRGAVGRRAGAQRTHRARPAGQLRGPQRGQDPRYGLWPGRAGQRLGGGRRPGCDERARRRRPGRHDGPASRPGRPHGRPGDLVRLAQRPGGAARARAVWRARAAAAWERHSGHVGRDPRVPRERPVPRGGRPARRHLDGDHPGRLRARPRAPLDHLAARSRAPGQLGRAGGRRPRARGHDGVCRHGLGRWAQRVRRARRRCVRRAGQRQRPGRHRPLRLPKQPARPAAQGPPS